MSLPLRFCTRSIIDTSKSSFLRSTTTSTPTLITSRSLSIKNSFLRDEKFRVGPAGAAMDTIKNTIAENFGGRAQEAGTHQFSLSQVPSQSGKVAIVTGGSEGIGYACTHTLLNRDVSKVFILSVSKEVVDGAKDAIAKDLGQEYADRTVWIQCDLSDWKRVAEVAGQIASQTDRIDVLINNAARGIMTYQLTEYGVDRHMALNHMGHVILTSHLLPIIKKTAEKGNTVRIANMASNAHAGCPSDTKFESVDELNRDLGPNGQYGRSKLAKMLHARYLARNVTSKYPNVLANCAHPGFVASKMSREDIHEAFPLGGYAMSKGLAPFQKDQFEGALSMMYIATVTDKSGEYICPPAVPEAGSSQSNDAALGDQLMKLTRELVAEKTKADSKDKGCPFDDVVLH